MLIIWGAASKLYLPVLCNYYFIGEYKYLTEGCKEDGAKLFSAVPSERTRQKLKYRKFQLNIRKTSYTVSVTEHWNRLPTQAVESPSLGILEDMS